MPINKQELKFSQSGQNRILYLSFLILCIIIVSGCGSPYYNIENDFDDARIIHSNYEGQEPASEYILQNGDNLEISFYYNPELSTAVTVRPDGLISLQLIGEVKVGGQTPAKVRQMLIENYSKILRYPEINITVKTFTSERIYVGGEVNHPQIIKLENGKTTLQAVFEAGGFRDTAEMRSVLILRGIGEPNFRVIKVDLMKLFLSKRLVKNDIKLQANDVVYVPKTLISRVNQFVDQYMNKIVPNDVFTDLIRGK